MDRGDCPSCRSSVIELRKRLHDMEMLVQRQNEELIKKVTQ